MAVTDPVSLVGYCGLYCGACRVRQGKIKEAVNNLSDIIASYGFDKIMPELANWEPSFKHYNEFKQVMDGLVKMFGYCPGCLDNGGDPNCKVRLCAKQKDYRTCTECNEAQSCQKLEPYRKYFDTALSSIHESGIKGYAEKMQKKAIEGYSIPEESNIPS
jgi:hypothetical protein